MSFVIPAQAGIHFESIYLSRRARWIPAFAGMTISCETNRQMIGYLTDKASSS